MLIELTLRNEALYEAAQHRKTEKYLKLASEVEANGFIAEIITLELVHGDLFAQKVFNAFVKQSLGEIDDGGSSCKMFPVLQSKGLIAFGAAGTFHLISLSLQ